MEMKKRVVDPNDLSQLVRAVLKRYNELLIERQPQLTEDELESLKNELASAIDLTIIKNISGPGLYRLE